MRDLAVDTDSPIGDDNVMRQLILATHSPYLLQLQEPADILIAKETTIRYGEATVPCFRCYPWQGRGARTRADEQCSVFRRCTTTCNHRMA